MSVNTAAYPGAASNAGTCVSNTSTHARANRSCTSDVFSASLSDTDSSSDVTFTFSEAPVGFTEADIHLSPGLSLVAGSLVQDGEIGRASCREGAWNAAVAGTVTVEVSTRERSGTTLNTATGIP